jgi:hypothetical protein
MTGNEKRLPATDVCAPEPRNKLGIRSGARDQRRPTGCGDVRGFEAFARRPSSGWGRRLPNCRWRWRSQAMSNPSRSPSSMIRNVDWRPEAGSAGSTGHWSGTHAFVRGEWDRASGFVQDRVLGSGLLFQYLPQVGLAQVLVDHLAGDFIVAGKDGFRNAATRALDHRLALDVVAANAAHHVVSGDRHCGEEPAGGHR